MTDLVVVLSLVLPIVAAAIVLFVAGRLLRRQSELPADRTSVATERTAARSGLAADDRTPGRRATERRVA